MAKAKKEKGSKKKGKSTGKGKKNIDAQLKKAVEAGILDVDLYELAAKLYYDYGISVLEDRAIPDYRDGMNPVNRRVLWSAHSLGIRSNSKFVKSALIVGDTLGKYHPHGDTSCYGAMVNMTNSHSSVSNAIVPLFDGEGNWGSLSDSGFAAMRYTETRLSPFTDSVIFDRFYLPAVEMCPNFDSSREEPVVLPALLPIALLNGKSGIAPGARAEIPAVDLKSLIKVLKDGFSGTELDAKYLYKNVRFVSTFGGVEIPPSTKEEKADRIAIFKARKGSFMLRSNPEFDQVKGTATVTRFANIGNMEKLILKLLKIDNVQSADDMSSKHDKYGTLAIRFKKKLSDGDFKKLKAKVEGALSSKEQVILNFTERYKDAEGQGQARIKAMSITDMLKNWIIWRTELERTACEHWIKEAAKDIRKLELLIIAVDNREVIIKSLNDRKRTQDELEAWLAKQLKVTKEEAHSIYQLRVIQLRALEKDGLQAKRKEVIEQKKELESRKKKPAPYIVKQLETFAKFA